MTWWEILIIVAACAFVIGVIAWNVVRKRQGKSGCGCDCGSCGGCSACSACKSPASKDDANNNTHTQQSP